MKNPSLYSGFHHLCVKPDCHHRVWHIWCCQRKSLQEINVHLGRAQCLWWPCPGTRDPVIHKASSSAGSVEPWKSGCSAFWEDGVFFVPNLDWAMFRAEQASSVVYKSISPEAGRGSSQRYLSAWGVWCQCKWVLASPCHEWPPSHLGSILLAEPATGGTICATKSKPNSSFPAAGKGRQRDSDSQAGWRVAHTLAPLWRRNGQ